MIATGSSLRKYRDGVESFDEYLQELVRETEEEVRQNTHSALLTYIRKG